MMAELVTGGLVVAATLMSVVGVIGFFRFPDAYTRLHATGMVATFGTVLLIVAGVVWAGVPVAKGVLMSALLLIASPVASHAISSAGLRIGLVSKAGGGATPERRSDPAIGLTGSDQNR